MRHDMFASSGVRHIALFDPESLGEPLELSKEDFDPRLRELAAKGRLILLHVPSGDCEASLALFVNEDPPEWLSKASRLVNERALALQVESGRFEACGAEDIYRPYAEREAGSFGVIEIPPAEYAGTVRITTAWKAKNRSRFIAKRSTAWSRRFAAFETVSGVLIAALVVFHIIGFGPFVGLGFKRSLDSGMTALAVVVAIDLIALAAFKGSAYLTRRFPGLRAAQEAGKEFELTYPDVLVLLRVRERLGAPECPGNVLKVNF